MKICTLRQISFSCAWTSFTRPMFLLLTKFSRHHSCTKHWIIKCLTSWVNSVLYVFFSLIQLFSPYYHWLSWMLCKCWGVSCDLLHWMWTSCALQAHHPAELEGCTAQCPLTAETRCSESPQNRRSWGRGEWSTREKQQGREALYRMLFGLLWVQVMWSTGPQAVILYSFYKNNTTEVSIYVTCVILCILPWHI